MPMPNNSKNDSSQKKTMLIVGASGLVGSAAIRKFSILDDWHVLGASRRNPTIEADFDFIRLNLDDREAVVRMMPRLRNVTHVIYAALFELPDLVAGWSCAQQMNTNQRMLENLFEPLLKQARGLQQVILLQGGKAYGAHLGKMRVPGRERSPRVEHANFYWSQEDYLRSAQSAHSWTLTIFRPQIVIGDALNAAMNLVPAIGVYAALSKERGRALDFPGGPPVVLEAVDADLLADAFAWAVATPEAANETFNVTTRPLPPIFSREHSSKAILQPLLQAVIEYCLTA